jgi:hypothetical protein
MSCLRDREIELGQLATSTIAKAGGHVTFDEYDRLMYPVVYFPPINWAIGWGLPGPLRKANHDKMCVFMAVKHGLVKATPNGYTLV